MYWTLHSKTSRHNVSSSPDTGNLAPFSFIFLFNADFSPLSLSFFKRLNSFSLNRVYLEIGDISFPRSLSFSIVTNGVGAPLRLNLHRIDGVAMTTLDGKILNEHRGACGTQVGLSWKPDRNIWINGHRYLCDLTYMLTSSLTGACILNHSFHDFRSLLSTL